MESLERALREHPFLRAVSAEHVTLLTGCASSQRFAQGDFLLREGAVHGKLYLVREGTVAIESASPGGEAQTIETVGPGDVLGLSWLTPTTSHFDCRARDGVLAFAIDLACLKAKMATDPAFGYALTSHLLERVYDRLSRVRLQRLDIYR
jgi:CRP-like cAMP-binding protein